MTFTELAAAIDTATNKVVTASAVVRETEVAEEAFLAQKGMELAILRDDVAAAQDSLNEATHELNDLYAEMQRMMPQAKVVSEPVTIGKLPTSQEMKQTIMNAQRKK